MYNRSDVKHSSKIKHQIKTRMKTIMVGSVAILEEVMGKLWGENKDFDESQLTPEQQKYYEIFLEIREKIFDLGNMQMKSFDKDSARIYMKMVKKENDDG